MKRKIALACALCFSAFAINFELHAAIIVPVGLQTTNATMIASNLVPVAASPLPGIRQFSASGVGSAIYTNQTSGVAAVTGGLRTVSAAVIGQANSSPPTSYTTLFGPSGVPNQLVAILGLGGTLNAPNSASFTDGSLFVYELSGFNAQDPSTWLGGTLLGTYDLALTSVSTGPFGSAIAPVPAASMNISVGDALILGNTDYNLLFLDDQSGNFLSNYQTNTPPASFEGIYIEGEQDLDPSVTGFAGLDAVDLAALNTFAGLAGLTDLGGAGTAFATAFGAGPGVGPTFFAGISTTGDLFARATETNLRPVVVAIPEPTNILIWGGLFGFLFQRRSRQKTV